MEWSWMIDAGPLPGKRIVANLPVTATTTDAEAQYVPERAAPFG